MKIHGLLFSLLAASTIPQIALAESGRVTCPVVVDRETGKYASTKTKYHCYASARSAKRSGYSKFSHTDDSSCGSGGGSEHQVPGLTMAGPGEKRSVVFTATAGGTIQYSFPGGGEFEISIMSASSGRRVQRVLETSQASAGTASFAAQTAPIYVKVEGPGAWTAIAAAN